jgi:uncharacterized membrane protein YfcA
VFGFASGVFSYARKKLIDYKLGTMMLMVTIPLAIAGTFLAVYIDADILKTILGVGLLVIASTFLKAPGKEDVEQMNLMIKKQFPKKIATTTLITRDGEEISYTVCNRTEGSLLGAIGALFIGMIFTIPGVIIGGQIGPLVASRIPQKILEKSLAVLFILVAILMIANVVMN